MRRTNCCCCCYPALLSLLLLLLVIICCLGVAVSAFVANTNNVSSRGRQVQRTCLFSSKEALSEAQRLLEKARQLREQALQEEQQVHDVLAQKKAQQDAATDKLVEELFFTASSTSSSSSSSSSSLVDRLREKRLGVSTLEEIVDRLDEREVIASGLDHVEFQMVAGSNKAESKRIQDSDKDQVELDRLQGLIDQLIEAVAVLDQEFLDSKQRRGQKYVAHAEEEHWGGGKCAMQLQNRIREIRRERSDQFQKRLEEFREAQRPKDDDDHKFKGYTDLGTLN